MRAERLYIYIYISIESPTRVNCANGTHDESHGIGIFARAAAVSAQLDGWMDGWSMDHFLCVPVTAC
jgi:hypothetical protein